MLADILTLQERQASGAGRIDDVDALRKTLEMLHKDDRAVQRYFGLDKKGLIEWFESSSKLPASEIQHSSQQRLEEKIRRIKLLAQAKCFDNQPQSTFAGFYNALYSYFDSEFRCDGRYVEVSRCVDVESVLSSARSYVVSTIKRLSEKSLVHFLNTRISEGLESDLESFEHYLSTESPCAFLENYPVLADLLIRHLEKTSAYLYKIIFHFVDDADVLESVFDLPTRRIDLIELGLGDPHADGETVCVIRISGKSLVYKPRSNREAQLYDALLRLLHDKTADECFSSLTPTLVSRDDHCWIEKIDNRACDTPDELALFYRRAGAQIALVHALNGIDFHYENIIACGSSPVMIDLECLLTASMIDLQGDLPHASALFKVLKSNGQSVFSSGFLPYSPDSENDYSGLTAQRQFTTTTRQLIREQGFYHLKRVKLDKTPVLKHLPVFAGVQYSLEAYQEAFLAGFEFAYDEVMKNHTALFDLIQQHAAHLKTRVLIKNTQRYIDFIELTLHPRFMQCMLHRQLLLATMWSESNESLADNNVAVHELADLQNGHVPSFTMPVTTSRMLNSHGRFVATLGIDSPLESCRRKLSTLSHQDKVFQAFILKECLFPAGNEALPMNRRHVAKGVPDLQPAQYLAGALKIAAAIELQRIEGDEGDVAWTFMNAHPTTQHTYLSPMTNSLYSGMGGLAVFYMSLYRVSGRAEHLAQADQIVDSMNRSREHFDSDMAVSGYFGLASYLYVLINHQQVVGREIHRTTIDELLRKLGDFPQAGDEFDFLNGWCGTVTVLVNLYHLQPQKDLIPLIEKFSAAIRAELINDGGRFMRKTGATPLLTGFSHGISGVLHSFAKVYEVTHDDTLLALMADLLQDENSQMAHGCWLDLREPAKPAHMTKWCHGDAGILISRLQLKQTLKNVWGCEYMAMLEVDLDTCESNLWRQGLGSGYSLCHGDFGNLLCLLTLYRRVENHQGITRTLQALSEVADNFFNEDFMTQDSVPVLGMMLGLAGVGQALLSAINPTLPDVLALTFMGPDSASRALDPSGIE